MYLTQWEYKIVTAEYVCLGDSTRFSHWEYITEEQLNALGADGWEAVSYTYDAKGEGITSVLMKRANVVPAAEE